MRFKIAAVILFVFCFTSSFAQKYKQMMNDLNVNFYDVIKEADLYFETHAKVKGSGWMDYQRWKYENESKYYPTGVRNQVSPYFVEKIFQDIELNLNLNTKKRSFNNGWKDLGPYTVERITGHYSPGMGRVESFYIDPDDPLRYYIGSRSGGFWRSIDGGNTWQGTTDFLFASGVNTMAVSPTNHDSVLINIRNANNGVTHGIYRSVDGGLTWKITNFNPANLGKGGLGSGFAVNKIAIDPFNSNLVFVSTNDGLYRSSNNLSSWTKIVNGSISEIEFHPTDKNIVYIYDYYYWGTNKNVVLRSVNQGLNFSSSDTIAGNNNNTSVHLSTSPVCPNCLYFGSDNGVWKSIDNGMHFTFLINPPQSCGGFAVSDFDTSKMIYGYVDIVASADGGKSFKQVSWWSLGSTSFNGPSYVHADLHPAKCVKGIFYVGTDGYFCKSSDGGNSWQRLNEGTGIRENYVVGVSQSNSFVNICGSQDNGTSVRTDSGWIEIYGADGMEGIIHPLNSKWMIGSWQYGGRRRTRDGGITGEGVTPPGQNNGTWVAPLLFDPNNQMRVFSFSDSIYKSEDFGTSWTNIGSPNIGGIQHAAMPENNSNIMALAQNAVFRKTTDGGKNYTTITGLPNYSITDIAFDPNDDSTIVVTYNRYQNDNSKVYITHDLGTTWTNITYNLGNMPLYTVVIDHTPSSTIYVGAEIGVYYKKMNETTWQLYNQNLPNSTVNDLEIQYATNTLRAATWGRGLWEYSLVDRNNFPAITHIKTSVLPNETQPVKGVPMHVTAIVSYNGVISGVFVKWSKDNLLFNNTIPMTLVKDSTYISTIPLPDFPVGTKIYFKVYAVGSKGDTTITYKYMYTIKPFKYCDSKGASNTTANYINLVALNGMINTSGKDAYGDFMDSVITLYADSTYTLQINLAYHWAPDTTAGWIDYNHNAEFEQDELIVMSGLNSKHESFGTFKVPANTLEGVTRLRARSQYWNESPDPCGTRTGEVEDYTIIIRKIPVLAFLTDDSILCGNKWFHFEYTGDQLDSVNWKFTKGANVFTSAKVVDSFKFNTAGVYNITLTGYKYGVKYTKNKIITLSKLDTSVTKSGSSLIANATGVSYQWLDCAKGNTPVSGATNKIFTPTVSGLFSVELKQTVCTDTSTCVNFIKVGIFSSDLNSQIKIYPNPAQGNISIDLGSTFKTIHIRLTEINGKERLNEEFSNSQKCMIKLDQLSNGIYFIYIQTDNINTVFKMVKN